MMNDALINKYIGPGMCYNDMKLLDDVNIDNLAWKLNQMCFGRWSYDVDILEKKDNGELFIKVSFYCPIKHVCGFAVTTREDIQHGIQVALLDAVKLGFCYKKRHSDEDDRKTTAEVTKECLDNMHKKENEVLTTLEELDKIEQEIGMTKPEKLNDNEEFHQHAINKFGLRQDQIDFMKMFQHNFKIDNEVKFDSYVSAWNDMKHTGITTKKQLVSAGEQALDDFISWIKEVNKDNIANNNFVCPSDEEFYECCNN